MSLVWVEIDCGACSRIFKNKKRAFETIDKPILMEEGLAKHQIRRQIFERQDGICVKCGAILTKQTMHMDEKLARGEFDEDGHSGEISLENSWGLCSPCHIGPRGEHGDRQVKFSNRTDREPITR